MALKVCIIADGYPYKNSNHCVFVRDLVVEMYKQGVECTVVVPQMIMPCKKSYLPYHWEEPIDGLGSINIYAPKYISFTSKPIFMKLTMRSHMKAVKNVLENENIQIDVFYGHFIYLNGLTAVALAKEYGKKSYIACGENSNRLLSRSIPYSVGLKFHNWRETLNQVNGIICVSSENEKLLKTNGFIDENVSTCILPNGVNNKVFFPRNYEDCRKTLGINIDDFVVVFVGAFIERKGNKRVDEAIVDLKNVKSIYIGTGEFEPKSNCIYCGPVKHDDIPLYLSAADVFVLPTTGEGCCNAIVEAISCGLPIVSSNGQFNDDLLDDSYSIRVNPNSVIEIKKAIASLLNDRSLLLAMKSNAQKRAKSFSLAERASRVIEYIKRGLTIETDN